MKTRNALILAIGILILSGCTKEDEPSLDPYVSIYTDLECKDRGPLKGDIPGSNQTCVKWDYDGDSTLNLIHYNSGFNCCPEEILIDFEISGDTIHITERDSMQQCRCNCLYDLELTIHHLEAKKYTLHFDEPFIIDPKQPLVFEIDLTQTSYGKFCEDRDFYPWGI